MIKILERLKNTVNKYMADIRPARLTSCHSERKSVVSRPSILCRDISPSGDMLICLVEGTVRRVVGKKIIVRNSA
jgi:hypothetical protein